jgi:hypothetical protein
MGTVAVITDFDSYPITLLEWGSELYRQSVDNVFDTVIQQLLRFDALDTLQDVIIDDDGVTLLLCFDPILTQAEVQAVLKALQSTYRQAKLIDSPGKDTSAWWVIEIGSLAQTAAEVTDAGAVEPFEPGFVPASDPANSIAKVVDVDAALQKV